MRLTVQLDDDLYAMARAHAIGNGMSISKAICDLLRRRVGAIEPAVEGGQDPVTGLPCVRTRRKGLTIEDVRAAEDADLPVLRVAEEDP